MATNYKVICLTPYRFSQIARGKHHFGQTFHLISYCKMEYNLIRRRDISTFIQPFMFQIDCQYFFYMSTQISEMPAIHL